MLSRADEQKPNVILIEDAGFGKALIGSLKQGNLPVVGVQLEGDKKSRLLRAITKFTNCQVILLRGAPGRGELETELFSFPGGRRNDLVDALSQALAYEHVSYLWPIKRSRIIESLFLASCSAAYVDAASAASALISIRFKLMFCILDAAARTVDQIESLVAAAFVAKC